MVWEVAFFSLMRRVSQKSPTQPLWVIPWASVELWWTDRGNERCFFYVCDVYAFLHVQCLVKVVTLIVLFHTLAHYLTSHTSPLLLSLVYFWPTTSLHQTQTYCRRGFSFIVLPWFFSVAKQCLIRTAEGANFWWRVCLLLQCCIWLTRVFIPSSAC